MAVVLEWFPRDSCGTAFSQGVSAHRSGKPPKMLCDQCLYGAQMLRIVP